MPLPPHLFDEIVHKALASEVRREILLSLSKKSKYLSELSKEINKKPQTVDFHLKLLEEIGIVESKWAEGKKVFSIKDKKILEFLKEKKHIPLEYRQKPPHEIVLDMWDDMKKRLERIEALLEKSKKH
jgi:predicted transcriptional regulator